MMKKFKKFFRYLRWLEEKRLEYMIKSGRGNV